MVGIVTVFFDYILTDIFSIYTRNLFGFINILLLILSRIDSCGCFKTCPSQRDSNHSADSCSVNQINHSADSCSVNQINHSADSCSVNQIGQMIFALITCHLRATWKTSVSYVQMMQVLQHQVRNCVVCYS